MKDPKPPKGAALEQALRAAAWSYWHRRCPRLRPGAVLARRRTP